MNTINIEKKKCNFCGEDVAQDARRCPYCGSLLGNKINEPQPQADVEKQPEAVFSENLDSSVQADMGIKGESVTGLNMEEADIMPGSQNETQNPPISDILKTHFDYYVPVDDIKKKPLSNSKKVFLTSLSTILPGIGQIIGIIGAIIFLNADEDEDRKSFGKALLISSLIVFVISLLSWIIIAMGISSILR